MRRDVAVEIHAEKAGELQKPGIDAAERARDSAPAPWSMTVRSNQSSGCDVGEAVDRGRVGARVRSGRPSASSMAAGTDRPPAAISDTAASTGTEGWHTAMTCMSRPEQTDEADHQLDEIVEIEAAVQQRNVARVHPVGEVDVVVGQQRSSTVPRSRVEKCPESGATTSISVRLPFALAAILAEMHQVAERVRRDDLLG